MSSTPQYGIGQYGSSQYSLGNLPSGASGAPSVGHQLTVDAVVRALGTPEPRNTFNQFDEHGLLVGLGRLRGETNWHYKRRVLDVFTHRANSSYRGLVNGITRELGLELFSPIQINPRRSLATNQFFAPDPYIRFDGVWLCLYSDFANGVLDHKIDRFEPGGNYEHLGRLVEFINSTTYFEAVLMPGVDYYTRSMSVINQSNRLLVEAESLVPSMKQRLQNGRILPSSILFNDSNTLRNPVTSTGAVTALGKYHLDAVEGILTTYRAPAIEAFARYEHIKFPFQPLASPVILHDVSNDNFRVKMFEQVLQDDGSLAHGLPTELGVDIINELLSVVPMYWGI